jgi:hypothetical protein
MTKSKFEGIDYSYQKSVSFSQYSTYKTCNYRWYLDKVKKLEEFKKSIHLIFGTALHETLQLYLQTMYDTSIKEADAIDLVDFFKTKFVELYQENSKEEHFSTAEQLREFFSDAIDIIEAFKRRRQLYFSKKGVKLIGIEIPVLTKIVDEVDNVFFRGAIDLVLYDQDLDKYTIYDIKTSTRGWSDYEKKDQTKINQILLYKGVYSKLMNIPEEKIEVEFFIVKRKLPENTEYAVQRIQEFKPANGTKKVKQAMEDFQAFVRDVFTPEGKFIDKEYPKNLNGCRFCPYIDKPDICKRD